MRPGGSASRRRFAGEGDCAGAGLDSFLSGTAVSAGFFGALVSGATRYNHGADPAP